MKTLPQYIGSINEWVLNSDNDVTVFMSQKDVKEKPELCLRVQFKIFKKNEKELLKEALKDAKITPDDILNEIEGKFDSIDNQWDAYDKGELQNFVDLEYSLCRLLAKKAKSLNIPLLNDTPGKGKLVNFDHILRYLFNNIVEIMHNIKK